MPRIDWLKRVVEGDFDDRWFFVAFVPLVVVPTVVLVALQQWRWAAVPFLAYIFGLFALVITWGYILSIAKLALIVLYLAAFRWFLSEERRAAFRSFLDWE